MMLGERNKKEMWLRAVSYAVVLTYFVSSEFNALNSAEFDNIIASFYQRQQKPKIVSDGHNFLNVKMYPVDERTLIKQ